MNVESPLCRDKVFYYTGTKVKQGVKGVKGLKKRNHFHIFTPLWPATKDATGSKSPRRLCPARRPVRRAPLIVSAQPSGSAPSPSSTTASMLAFQAFHLAAYHFAPGTFQPTAAGSARGCSELDSLLGGGPDPVDLNAALDVCFDAQFSCSHAEVCSGYGGGGL